MPTSRSPHTLSWTGALVALALLVAGAGLVDATAMVVPDDPGNDSDAAAPLWSVSAVSSPRSSAASEAGLARIALAPGDHASWSRAVGLGGPLAVLCRFNVTIEPDAGSRTTSQVLRIGSGFSGSLADERDADTFGRIGFAATESGFQVRDLQAGRLGPAFLGTQAVTWALNNSGRVMSYPAPDGTVESIASGRMDVWVGRQRVFDEMLATSPRAPLSSLKWYWSAGSGTTTFDHVDVRPLDEGLAAMSAPGADAAGVGAPEASVGDDVVLYKPSPNPFERTTRFAYALSGSQRVDIGIFDVAGRRIRGLVRGTQTTGQYQVVWNGLGDDGVRARDGVYFLRAVIGPDTRIARIVYLVK